MTASLRHELPGPLGRVIVIEVVVGSLFWMIVDCIVESNAQKVGDILNEKEGWVKNTKATHFTVGQTFDRKSYLTALRLVLLSVGFSVPDELGDEEVERGLDHFSTRWNLPLAAIVTV
jgi:hypothetical protein